jgi:DNA-binding transcriptional LysR family regulator
MTYDQLVAFTTVAAEGTFTGASEALHGIFVGQR